MRRSHSLLVALLVAACAPATPAFPDFDPDAVRASLIAADEAFAAATAERGLEGWMAAFDRDRKSVV